MKYWVISDTHFEDDNMHVVCGRPQDFEKSIIDNWNKVVSDNDIVIHLGDVSWTSDTYMSKLKGRKILVKGNHDTKSLAWYMENGFEFACKTFTMNFGGLDIIFSHKPLFFHEHDVNIHGHLHNCASIESVCPHYLIALEFNGYSPANLSTIAREIRFKLGKEKVKSQTLIDSAVFNSGNEMLVLNSRYGK